MGAQAMRGDRVLAYVARGHAKVRERALAGLCVWGDCPEPTHGRRYCARHAARIQALKRARYRKLLVEGRCPRCLGALDRKATLCSECAATHVLKGQTRIVQQRAAARVINTK